MTRRMRFALALYPKAWRQRYASEFAALLEQTGPSWRDFFNVLGGALHMQLRSLSFVKLTTILAVTGLLAAAVTLLFLPPRYMSRSTFRLNDRGQAAGPQAAQALHDVINDAFSRSNLEPIITGLGLYPERVGHEPTAATVTEMRRNIDVRLMGARTPQWWAFTLSFSYPDGAIANQVNSALVAKVIESFQRPHGLHSIGNLELLDPPSRPERPISPNPRTVLLLGLVGGMLLSTLIFVVLKLTGRRRQAA